MISLKTPYLLFLGDAPDQLAVKVAQGVRDWRPENCLGQIRLPGCQADLGVPDMDLKTAWDQGARTLLVGVANRGGIIAPSWMPVLTDALRMGYDIAAGLHERLGNLSPLADIARNSDVSIHDVRHPSGPLIIGSGEPRNGKRLLAVGTDCSCGKMYTTLALEKAMQARGLPATFAATGQTGILITGTGISIDAVPADFISGAVEELTPDHPDPGHWSLIEGQGSLYHPSFAGVSLGLLHGAQADGLVLCHEPTRTHMRGLPDYPIPPIKECLGLNLQHARLTNPQARFVGVSVNTFKLDDAAAQDVLARLSDETGLPAVDPVRTGVEPLVDALVI